MEDRCIIRNADYFSPDSPRGPPAFWISRCLVTLAVLGAVPTCKTSSRSYSKVSPQGVGLAPGWFISVLRSVCKPVKSIVVAAEFARGIALRWDERQKRRGADGAIKWWRATLRHAEKQRSVESAARIRGHGLSKHHRGATLTFYLVPVVCGATVVSTSPLGNSCVSLFQRYFFLIYQIPQDRSISRPWHRLPPYLGPKEASLGHMPKICTHAQPLPSSRHSPQIAPARPPLLCVPMVKGKGVLLADWSHLGRTSAKMYFR